jgi:hypothetical protein
VLLTGGVAAAPEIDGDPIGDAGELAGLLSTGLAEVGAGLLVAVGNGSAAGAEGLAGAVMGPGAAVGCARAGAELGCARAVTMPAGAISWPARLAGALVAVSSGVVTRGWSEG